MAVRTLELVVKINGHVELHNNGEPVWTSDGDDDFAEFIESDFVNEDDIDEVLSYLRDSDIISADELEAFENDDLPSYVEEPDD